MDPFIALRAEGSLQAKVRRLVNPALQPALETIRRRLHPALYRLLRRELLRGAEARLELEAQRRLENEQRQNPTRRTHQGERPSKRDPWAETWADMRAGWCAECSQRLTGRQKRFCSRECGNRNRNRGRQRVGKGLSPAETARRRLEERLRRHFAGCRTCRRGEWCPERESMLHPGDALAPRRRAGLDPEAAERVRERADGKHGCPQRVLREPRPMRILTWRTKL